MLAFYYLQDTTSSKAFPAVRLLHRLAHQGNGFLRILQAFPALAQPVLHHNLRLGIMFTMIKLGGVDGDGLLLGCAS